MPSAPQRWENWTQWKSVPSIRPDAYTGSPVNGAAVDRQGSRWCKVTLDLNAVAAGETVDVKIQESADGSTGWSDITGAAFATKDQNSPQGAYVASMQLEMNQRYLRAVATLSGGTGHKFAVTFELSGPGRDWRESDLPGSAIEFRTVGTTAQQFSLS